MIMIKRGLRDETSEISAIETKNTCPALSLMEINHVTNFLT